MKNPCEECIVRSMCSNNCKEFSEYFASFELTSIKDIQKIDIRPRIQTFIEWYIDSGAYNIQLPVIKNGDKEKE